MTRRSPCGVSGDRMRGNLVLSTEGDHGAPREFFERCVQFDALRLGLEEFHKLVSAARQVVITAGLGCGKKSIETTLIFLSRCCM